MQAYIYQQTCFANESNYEEFVRHNCINSDIHFDFLFSMPNLNHNAIGINAIIATTTASRLVIKAELIPAVLLLDAIKLFAINVVVPREVVATDATGIVLVVMLMLVLFGGC
jgi:hypothetical protein